MPSKMLTDRQKTSRAVEQAAEVHAEELAAALGSELAGVLEPGEALPDVGLLARLFGRLLGERRKRLEAVDAEHLVELADDRDPRRRRNEAAERLREVLVEMRETVDGVFGAGRSAELLGLGGRLRDPVVAAMQGRRVLDRLADGGFAWPPAKLRGVAVAAADWVAAIAPPLTALEAALADVRREAREAESSLAAKLDAMADFDETFAHTARLLEALFDAAGLTVLAQRVRPSPAKPGRTQEEPAETEEAETAAASPRAGGGKPPGEQPAN